MTTTHRVATISAPSPLPTLPRTHAPYAAIINPFASAQAPKAAKKRGRPRTTYPPRPTATVMARAGAYLEEAYEPPSMEEFRKASRKFTAFKATVEGANLDEVDMLLAWISTHEVVFGNRPTTLFNYTNFMKTVWSFTGLQHLTKDPRVHLLTKSLRKKMAAIPRKRARPMDFNAALSTIQTCRDPGARTVMLIAWLTASRMGDARRLHWEDPNASRWCTLGTSGDSFQTCVDGRAGSPSSRRAAFAPGTSRTPTVRTRFAEEPPSE